MTLTFPCGEAGGGVRVRRAAEAAAVLHHPARAVGLVVGVRLTLDLVFLLKPSLRLPQPVWPRPRDRPCLGGALLVETALGLAQPPPPALSRRQLGRQLVAAPPAEALVLRGVDSRRVLENLGRDLLVVARRVMRRVCVHLRAINGEHADIDQPRLRAEREHLAKQPGERRLVALTEARDGRVIRRLVHADHARRDVLHAAPLDPPRRPLPDRIGVEQQRHHHRRIVRRPTMTIRPIGGIERRQVELAHSVDHEPREMPFRQPFPQARRQQQLLLTITTNEVLRHAPDRPHQPGHQRRLRNSHREKRQWTGHAERALAAPYDRTVVSGVDSDRVPRARIARGYQRLRPGRSYIVDRGTVRSSICSTASWISHIRMGPSPASRIS